jgi:hypothetical protein
VGAHGATESDGRLTGSRWSSSLGLPVMDRLGRTVRGAHGGQFRKAGG